MGVKQIIVIRRDLKSRRGKECAQAAHASIAFLSNRLAWPGPKGYGVAQFSNEELEWLKGSFTKVVVQAADEAELLDVHNKAKEAGLTSVLITDAGLTEFGGTPTRTAVAIGPHDEEKLAPITGHLKLY